MEFYYYAEDSEKNLLIKNKVVVDAKKLNELENEIFEKYASHQHFDYSFNQTHNFSNSTVVMDLRFNAEKKRVNFDEYTIPYLCQIIKDILFKKEEINFYSVLDELDNGIDRRKHEKIKELELQVTELSKSNKYDELNKIKEKISKLQEFYDELSKYYKMVRSCISVTAVETISIDDINRVKNFFELDNAGFKTYEGERVKALGTFENKRPK